MEILETEKELAFRELIDVTHSMVTKSSNPKHIVEMCFLMIDKSNICDNIKKKGSKIFGQSQEGQEHAQYPAITIQLSDIRKYIYESMKKSSNADKLNSSNTSVIGTDMEIAYLVKQCYMFNPFAYVMLRRCKMAVLDTKNNPDLREKINCATTAETLVKTLREEANKIDLPFVKKEGIVIEAFTKVNRSVCIYNIENGKINLDDVENKEMAWESKERVTGLESGYVSGNAAQYGNLIEAAEDIAVFYAKF